MISKSILILGGYGNFGQRIVRLLAKDPTWHILIGGRRIAKAQKLTEQIKTESPDANINTYFIDWQSTQFLQQLKASQCQLLIHAAGSFHQQSYVVPKTAIELGIHYIDIADNRAFVCGIDELDEMAKNNQIAVISGAGALPGLSSCIIDSFIDKFEMLREIYYGISPGNQLERGLGNIASILGSTGKPFDRLEKGRWNTVYGWQDLHRHYYGDLIGKRWHANVDIPDLTLFPSRYPKIKSVVFHAGLEVAFLHWVLWQMSWLGRFHLVNQWHKMVKPISTMSRWFKSLCTNISGMHIQMTGSNHQYQPLELNWRLVAEHGHGLYVPAATAVIIAKKLQLGLIEAGARPCLGLFTLDEFDRSVRDYQIYHTLEEKVM
jgi:saccharopine dehydrogenase-like NADP-dependent oxidoreductase